MKRVFVSNLEEGMVVGRDIYTSGNLLILPAGVVLTKAIIEHLESLDLLDILIDDEKKPEDVEPKEPVQSPNFIEFNKNYTSQINKLNNTFDKILENGASKEEVENLLENTWESMPQTSNTYEMLNMLYSMHSYSDATYMHCMNVGIIASLIGKWMGWFVWIRSRTCYVRLLYGVTHGRFHTVRKRLKHWERHSVYLIC